MTARRPWPRSRGIRLGVVAGLAVLTIGGGGVASASAIRPAFAPAIRPASPSTAPAAWPVSSQVLVVVLGDHVARRAPNADAGRIEAVAARRPLTRSRTVLPELGHGGHDDAWLRVRLPGRPNGHAGWISAGRTRLTSTSWRIVVSLSARRVFVFRDGRVVRRFPAIVGKASTPTPRGTFFVEEALRLSSSAPGAPFALATSARSNVLQEFDGGPGQIALHGTDHLSGTLGTAASHGCIRLAPHAIAWMASRIGAGAPVSIRARYVPAAPPGHTPVRRP
jgi:lipoprotein-anchoring transpeptidase ErfK/SrfK